MKTGEAAWTAQWLAAFAGQTVSVSVSAAKRGIRDHGDRESRVFGELYRAVLERGAAGDLLLCPHLSYDEPAASFWMAWHPEMLRCAKCVRETVTPEVAGQANKDLICDLCGFVSATIDDVWSGYGQIQVLTPLPLVIIAGFCRTCAEGDGL